MKQLLRIAKNTSKMRPKIPQKESQQKGRHFNVSLSKVTLGVIQRTSVKKRNETIERFSKNRVSKFSHSELL